MTSHQSEWPSSNSLQMVNAKEGLEKKEPSYPVHGHENCCSHYEEQYRYPSKSKNRAAIWSSNPAHRDISRENHNSKKDTMFTAALFIIAKAWKQSRSPLTEELGKEDVVYTYSGILATHKKWNSAIWMNEPGGHHTKWSKSGRKRQVSYDITYMQNLKKNDTNEFISKTETGSQT